MKITTKHMGAIARHLADVLGDAETARAEVVTEALLGPAPVYTDLAAVDTLVVSEGLRDAQVSVPAIRRGAIAALFGLVHCGAPTCNRCGRLPLALTGSTWAAVTTPTCPVDAGLYEAAEAAPTVRGWHDGREYPADATHDPAGVPLTSEKIREERGVSPMVDAALRETGATLLDVLAATVAEGASPAEALVAVGEPLRRWVSAVALRAFVARAKGAAARAPSGGATPPPFAGAEALGPIDARALRDVLASLYKSAGDINRVAWEAGVNTSLVDLAGSAVTAWFNVIGEAARTGRVGALFAVARKEYPNYHGVRALVEASAPDAINWQRLTGPQWKALQDALTSAFPSRAKLEQLVSFGLDERLDMISCASALGHTAFEVIQWSQARGHTRRLFDEARRLNPGNPDLRALAARGGL